jgi:hypothetical protein
VELITCRLEHLGGSDAHGGQARGSSEPDQLRTQPIAAVGHIWLVLGGNR